MAPGVQALLCAGERLSHSTTLLLSPPPGLNASVARLARASLQQKNIRANVDTLAIKPGEGSIFGQATCTICVTLCFLQIGRRTELTILSPPPA